MQTFQEHRQRYILLNGDKIAVTEEVYRAYMRPEWAEDKRRERESRCIGKNGSRCKKDCRKCGRKRAGRPLSLEQLRQDGFDIPYDCVDPADLLIAKECLAALSDALDALEPDNLRIVKMLFLGGMTEQKVADKIGLTQSGVNKKKIKVFEHLRYQLKDFYFLGT